MFYLQYIMQKKYISYLVSYINQIYELWMSWRSCGLMFNSSPGFSSWCTSMRCNCLQMSQTQPDRNQLLVQIPWQNASGADVMWSVENLLWHKDSPKNSINGATAVPVNKLFFVLSAVTQVWTRSDQLKRLSHLPVNPPTFTHCRHIWKTAPWTLRQS